jgi:hypothetical protein
VYGTDTDKECKEKCSNITSNDNNECSSRSDDCLWLNGRTGDSPVNAQCINKVWILCYITFLFYLLLLLIVYLLFIYCFYLLFINFVCYYYYLLFVVVVFK